MKRTVLLVDDDTAIRTVLSQALSRAGYEVKSTANIANIWQWIAAGQGDLVLTDVVLPDGSGFDLLQRARARRPDLPVVVMSAKNTIMTAISAAEKGAFEYLPKPFDLQEMLAVVARGLDQSGPRQPVKAERGQGTDEQMPIVGRSQAMQEIYRLIARMTQTDLTVLIIGESGTGKELVARVLHDYGKRRNKPFVAINMAAIPRELIESELFGHQKGAFTGATGRYAGRFEQAEGGTLFLDEIGDMPMEAQTRLLRVLQQGEYTSVGGTRPVKTDVRIIAATHRDLKQLIAQGLFREDLYFRLNVVPVRLPPLRERLDDIGDLVAHKLETAISEGLPQKRMSPGAVAALQSYHWPGNVRELENLVRRLCVMISEDEISGSDIERELVNNFSATETFQDTASENLSELVEHYLAGQFARYGSDLPPNGLYERVIRDVERPLIAAALGATGGNQLRAAELLGINRNTLRTRIRDLDLSVFRNNSTGLQSA
jgi:two-component system nitrogen regulation response regulator GlnG